MRYFEKKHIHSCFASMSSGDEWVVREVTRREFLDSPVNGENRTVSKKHGISIVYIDADKRFYNVNNIRDRPAKDVFDKYIYENYLLKGWTLNHPFVDEALKAHWADEDDERTARRTKEGYVIPRWEKDLPVESYQGGFSDEVFNEPYLQNYLKGGGCHGYIGHAARRPQTDAYLESQWLKHNTDRSLLAMWLTSTGGRHFADWKEGCPIAEQKAYIKERIVDLIAQANSYREKE